MTDYDFPYGFVYTYKDSDKHFITDERFISHYLLYIIDYFYTKNIDISDAINIDNINKCLVLIKTPPAIDYIDNGILHLCKSAQGI